MQNTSPRAVLSAALASALTVIVLVTGTLATEFLDKESTSFGVKREFLWSWFLQSWAPFGQTGLINESRTMIGNWLPAYLIGAAVLVVVVFLVSWLGARGAHSALTVWFTTWFATVLGSGLGAAAVATVGLVINPNERRFYRDEEHLLVKDALVNGYYWGMFVGLFVGLVVMLVWHVRRPRETAYAGVPQGTPRAQAPGEPQASATQQSPQSSPEPGDDSSAEHLR